MTPPPPPPRSTRATAPPTPAVRVRVSDGTHTTTAAATVTVNNAAPTRRSATGPSARATRDGPLTGVKDVAADNAAGFRYAYDFDSTGYKPGGASATTRPPTARPTIPVNGRGHRQGWRLARVQRHRHGPQRLPDRQVHRRHGRGGHGRHGHVRRPGRRVRYGVHQRGRRRQRRHPARDGLALPDRRRPGTHRQGRVIDKDGGRARDTDDGQGRSKSRRRRRSPARPSRRARRGHDRSPAPPTPRRPTRPRASSTSRTSTTTASSRSGRARARRSPAALTADGPATARSTPRSSTRTAGARTTTRP